MSAWREWEKGVGNEVVILNLTKISIFYTKNIWYNNNILLTLFLPNVFYL